MKYMVIAGEASGDLHAGELIKSIRLNDPVAEFLFFGGEQMALAASREPLLHYREMAFMGFSEVLRNLNKISANLRLARETLKNEKPDALILVDYPSFNLKVAKTAHALGIPCYWYISPKLWAWKAWRIKAIRKLIRKVLCILPFEPKWYAEHDYKEAVYVGNPTVAELTRALAAAPSREEFLAKHRLRNRPLLALLPGSRHGEIRCNLPVMDAVARQFPQYTIVVAGAPNIPDEFYRSLSKFAVIKDDTHNLLAHSHAALVTSGTATLEAAVARVPQVVMYRSNGSKISYNLMKSLLHVKFVSLPNLIADRQVVPEMLLHECTPEAVIEKLRLLTPENSPVRLQMLKDYDDVSKILGNTNLPGETSAADAALTIISDLSLVN